MVRKHALGEHDVVQLPKHVLPQVPVHDACQGRAALETTGLGEPHPPGHCKTGIVFPQRRRLQIRNTRGNGRP